MKQISEELYPYIGFIINSKNLHFYIYHLTHMVPAPRIAIKFYDNSSIYYCKHYTKNISIEDYYNLINLFREYLTK